MLIGQSSLRRYATLAILLVGVASGVVPAAPARSQSGLSFLEGQLADADRQAQAAFLAGIVGAAIEIAGGLGNIWASGGSATSAAMSCPVFAGSTALLTEDECIWSSANARHTTWSSTESSSVLFRIGGQKQVASGWFLGGSLGAGPTWAQASGISAVGRTFDGSVALKYASGPWLLAAAVGVATNATHATRQTLAGPASPLESDINLYQGGLRLRSAYAFAFDDWYLRPRLDLDLVYTNVPGFQEYGQNSLALAAAGREKVNVGIAPMVEFGVRRSIADATILRLYLTGGAIFVPDNTSTVTLRFASPLAPPSSVQVTSYAPNVAGVVNAGLQLYESRGLEMKLELGLSAAQSFFSQQGSLRLSRHF